MASKTLEIVRDNFGLWVARYSAGGTVPEVVSGQWTRYNSLQNKIDAYNVEQAKPKRRYSKGRGKQNAEATSTDS